MKGPLHENLPLGPYRPTREQLRAWFHAIREFLKHDEDFSGPLDEAWWYPNWQQFCRCTLLGSGLEKANCWSTEALDKVVCAWWRETADRTGLPMVTDPEWCHGSERSSADQPPAV